MTTAPVPLEVLFGARERLDPQLSPDGRLIAYRALHAGVSNLWLHDLADGSTRPLTTHATDGVGAWYSTVSLIGRSSFYRWAFDGRHVVYVRDRGSDEAYRLHVVDTVTGEWRDVTPEGDVQVRVLALSPRRPHEVLFEMNLRDPAWHDLWKLDLRTLTCELVRENDGWTGWLVDDHLAVVGGVARTPSGGSELRVFGEGATSRTLLAAAPEELLTCWGMDGDGRALVATSAGAPAARLVTVDLASAELVDAVADPEFDLRYPLVDERTGVVRAGVFQRVRAEVVAVDAGYQRDLAWLRANLPGGLEPQIVSRDLSDERWVIELASGRSLDYQLFDRVAGRCEPLFRAIPALEGYALAEHEPFTVRASDGLRLRGYLLAPPRVPRERLPTVLLVHGGPASRHTFGWTDVYMPMAQAIATRGRLVIEVDFRGSAGYGTEFLRAGDREWGARMQTDLFDVLDWTVSEGWADPSRVGIIGVSYGGYAALAAAAFTPERVACAVDVCGPSSLLTTFETMPAYWESARASLIRQLGDPDEEPAFLWSRSPLSKVDELTTPLLVAHGARDPRVSQKQTEQLVTALHSRGVDCPYLLFEDEGHVFTQPRSWITLMEAVELFFAEHLDGPRSDSGPAA